ncbi:YggS family pyridoxal phosphate-dependent enzyme [Govanella unica]|uniref:Pyridoxal phosphate homeostasis protein n=1 Tax=Govanella unica TaxID=2975056 RepID=A0A9X3TVS6_9PROT|nr:YggS family pyridoxal phosphate-dependent enzyme [Govania unica]MDA5192444.1 YggS family pyridoxal phosphate-dependent enzyme [Govania unica]
MNDLDLTTTKVTGNLAQVKTAIAKAAHAAGRNADDVTLVAVSKTHDADAILPALKAGQLVFGENRVQEAQAKWPALRALYPAIELHLIGPLQSNKVPEAVATFDVIESLDREKLARALATEFTKQGVSRPCYIQVNTGGEDQKAGVTPRATDAFIKLCRDDLGLPVVGLMCIPPVHEEPAPHFALLRKIAARNGLTTLSMGMSGDFESAIALGATHVRIGTAIFGSR